MTNITLTEEQRHAINAMLDFTESSDSFFILSGYAGTGKTVSLQYFAMESTQRIAFTAPTNKATKVMRAMAEEWGLNIPCKTIHSLLGLGLQEDREKPEAEKLGQSSIDAFDVIVVDEASMVDENLFTLIKQAVEEYNIKVIFVGDPKQLPPINEHHSKTFDIAAGAKLNKIVRQAENSPIIKLTEDIRLAIDGASLPDMESYNVKGIHSVDYMTWDAWMRDAFSTQANNGNADRVRVLAWRNKTVIRYNDIARHELYGPDASPFMVGEHVIAAKPIRAMGKDGFPYTVMSVDEEATVVKATRTMHDRHQNFEITQLVMKGAEGKTIYAKVCWPESIALLKKELDALALEARSQRGSWQAFYQFKNAFNDIRPCHALTVHRSQGSTYDIVFVDVQDILANRRRSEALRCLYVACSRASELVVLG